MKGMIIRKKKQNSMHILRSLVYSAVSFDTTRRLFDHLLNDQFQQLLWRIWIVWGINMDLPRYKV